MSRKQTRKMQPRPSMPATVPTFPLPAAETAKATPKKAATEGATKMFDFEKWTHAGTFQKKCSHDAKQFIEIAGVRIYAADGWGVRKAPWGSVVLNCTGTAKFSATDIPDSFSSLRKHLDEPMVEEITLPWPDGGVPPVKASFWRALVEACAARKAPLVIHCIGGHGRTGTALAAILITYSIPADDAVAYVRKNHCDRAIETLAQERYLDDLDDELNIVEDLSTIDFPGAE